MKDNDSDFVSDAHRASIDFQHGAMSEVDWDSMDSKQFWDIADNLQNEVLQKAGKLFESVQFADVDTLRAILIQYRFFTIYYITDSALLIAKLNDGKARSFLAEILSDELGCGDANKAHPNLYDSFLVSIGVDKRQLDKCALKENIKLLDDARDLLTANEQEFGIGLRGMGGECVCQVYIELLHKHLVLNPYIAANKSKIDWIFWDLHVGDHDIQHRIATRALIHDEIVSKNGAGLRQLGYGYGESMRSWEKFWNNIFYAALSPSADSGLRS